MRSKLWKSGKTSPPHSETVIVKKPHFNYARVAKIRTMFESFFARFAQIIPRVKAADEDLIDPQQVLRSDKILHEIRSQEKPKPKEISENTIPVDPSNNPKPIPVANKTDESSNNPKDAKKLKNLACKDDNTNDGGADGKGKGGSGSGSGNGNGNGNGGSTLVDPLDILRDKCREHRHAVTLAKKYEDCNTRVLSKSQTSETCVEELFDLLHAIDHCVTEKLFSQLK